MDDNDAPARRAPEGRRHATERPAPAGDGEPSLPRSLGCVVYDLEIELPDRVDGRRGEPALTSRMVAFSAPHPVCRRIEGEEDCSSLNLPPLIAPRPSASSPHPGSWPGAHLPGRMRQKSNQ